MAGMSPLAVALSMQQPIEPSSRAQIAPTDVLGAYKLSTDAANTQYLAKLQQQNSLWGGLAGLGGSALTASILRGFNPFSALSGAGTGAASGAGSIGGGLAAGDVAAGTAPLASLGGLAGGAGDLAMAAPAAGDMAGALGAGTVGADLASAAVPAAADAAAGFSLADILPFLLAV